MAAIFNICVIDDEMSIRDTFKWHLEDQGHKVTAFDCPDEMISYCDKCFCREMPCFDVIFVDYNMLPISGLDFLIHSTLPHCKLPANRKFLMSGAFTNQTKTRAQGMGFRALHKPVYLHTLTEILESLYE